MGDNPTFNPFLFLNWPEIKVTKQAEDLLDIVNLIIHKWPVLEISNFFFPLA